MLHPDPIDVHVGLMLRKVRQARGLSLDELGQALGITYQQIQKYELGRNRISASRLLRASSVLNVPISTFFENLSSEGPTKDSEAATDLETAKALHRIQHERVQEELRRLINTLAGERS